MTCLDQFWNSSPCAPALGAELCSWMEEWIQHDGVHSCRSSLPIDCSLYDLYDISDRNFVGTVCVEFIFRVLM